MTEPFIVCADGERLRGDGRTTFALPNLGNRFVLCTKGEWPRAA